MRIPRLLALLLLVAPARAGEPAKVEMPFAPFAASQKGDFETLALRSWDLDGDRAMQKVALTYRVSEADDKGVKLEFALLPEAAAKNPLPGLSFKRDEKPAPPVPGATVETAENVAVIDTTRTIAGRTFPCKMVSFVTRRVLPQKATDDVVEVREQAFWCSSEVKGGGIVAFAVEAHISGGGNADFDSHSEAELVGFGNGDTCEWGKKASEVELNVVEAPPIPAERWLPMNPYSNAKEGDWQLLLQTTSTDDTTQPKQRLLLVFRVNKVEGDTVTLSEEVRAHQGSRTITGTVSRSDAMTLEHYAHFDPRGISDVTYTDDEKTFGDRKLACIKATFKMRRVAPLADQKRGCFKSVSVLWMSKDMPGRGFVGQTVETVATGPSVPVKVHLEVEVIGFGNGDTVAWGKKPADVKLEDFGK